MWEIQVYFKDDSQNMSSREISYVEFWPCSMQLSSAKVADPYISFNKIPSPSSPFVPL
jgi:hypothetical protein